MRHFDELFCILLLYSITSQFWRRFRNVLMTFHFLTWWFIFGTFSGLVIELINQRSSLINAVSPGIFVFLSLSTTLYLSLSQRNTYKKSPSLSLHLFLSSICAHMSWSRFLISSTHLFGSKADTIPIFTYFPLCMRNMFRVTI